MPEKPRRPPKPKAPNPVVAAVSSWLESVPSSQLGGAEPQALVDQAPRRWAVYEPMVLLPSGSFTSPAWTQAAASVPPSRMGELWESVLAGISATTMGGSSSSSSSSSSSKKSPLTHLAINEGIPLHSNPGSENVLRSPSGLRILHGDFGPHDDDPTTKDGGDEGGDGAAACFARAFWVSTKQNGIYQTWAPRWTMFSRGNVKEKARLLEFHHSIPPVSTSSASSPSASLPHRSAGGGRLRDAWAVDLYAGIGYFVFSYARLGLRVLCWELNPWSVEGLRRGALGNRWGVRVIQGGALEQLGHDDNSSGSGDGDHAFYDEILRGDEKIIVFLEDNRRAAQRIARLQQRSSRLLDRDQGGEEGPAPLDIRHVNCGFLPTSEPSWRDAREIALRPPAGGNRAAWLHLHENVGVSDIEARKAEIQRMFDNMGREDKSEATVEHVELVKTFAPGVWHCVFDVYITSSSIT
ncbi:S-adenosyl-L-methionine-dependent methyltransferase [Xylariales sp. PMI_506]|nr:S-adenosyl-L-methionine-dependent methyltransferase [Xylariales sp. PMI_506]